MPSSQVNELVFFHLVDQIAPVKNIRMIAHEGQLKAFVQVEDHMCAERVIAALNGQLMNVGKVKVFISNKGFVNYEQPLDQVIQKCLQEEQQEQSVVKRNSYSTLHIANVQSGRQIDNCTESPQPITSKVANMKIGGVPLNPAAQRPRRPVLIKMNNFLDSSALSQPMEEQPATTTPINPLHAIKVTHSDEESLSHNRMLRVFRRFGRVINLVLDEEASCWTIVYRSTKDVEKAVKAVEEGKLFGYRLHGTNNSRTSIDQRGCGRKNFEREQPAFAQRPAIRAALRVTFNNTQVPLGSVAALVSRTHLPSKLTCFTNHKTSRCYYLVEYDYLYQAAEALVSLSHVPRDFEGCRARFASWTD